MYNNILYATDLNENHFALCKEALAIANRFDASLHLLHVIELPASIQLAQGLGFTELATPSKEDALTVITLLGEALNLPKEQLHVEIGSVKSAILEMIKELNCGLLILGSPYPTTFPTLPGSTIYAMFHQAPCDVMTIRENNKN